MLTEHFSYNEMTRSAWAERNGVDNTPDALQLLALENLCQVLLEPLRQQFGPILINSAFRSEAVNYGVHGVGGSKHLSGEAVDIRIPDVETGRPTTAGSCATWTSTNCCSSTAATVPCGCTARYCSTNVRTDIRRFQTTRYN